MKGLIYVGKVARPAICELSKDDDIQAILEWRTRTPASEDPRVLDALEFADFAGKRWRSYRRVGCSVSSPEELKTRISANSQEELAMMATVKCDDPKLSPILGFCLFRRTWCNHLALDFLAANQEGRAGLGPKIGAAGVLLAGFVCELAAEIGAAQIWCETTHGSAKTYEDWFGLKGLLDVMHLSAKTAAAFLKKLRADWKQNGLQP